MFKKNILLCTVAGTLFCSHFNVAFANNAIQGSQRNLGSLLTITDGQERMSLNSHVDLRSVADYLDDQWVTIENKKEELARDIGEFSRSVGPFSVDQEALSSLPDYSAASQPHGLRHLQEPIEKTKGDTIIQARSLRTKAADLKRLLSKASESKKKEIELLLAQVETLTKNHINGDELFSNLMLEGSPVDDLSINGARDHESLKKISDVSYPNRIITIKDATIYGKFPMTVSENGVIYGVNISVSEGAMVGLSNLGGRFELYDSDINVKWRGGVGVMFTSENENDHVVKLVNTNIHVGDGIGIFGSNVTGQISLENSKINADVLVKKRSTNQYPFHLTITADNSVLRGGIRTALEEKASVRAVLKERGGARNFQDTQTDQRRKEVLSVLLQHHEKRKLQLETEDSEDLSGQLRNARSDQVSREVSKSPVVNLQQEDQDSQLRLTVRDAPQGVTVFDYWVEPKSQQKQVAQSNWITNTSLSTINLDLRNNSKWYLTFSKDKMDDVGLDSKDETQIESRKRRLSSDLASLKIRDSSVIFVEPQNGDRYKTLYVGFGNEGNVYVAEGDAKLFINAELDDSKKIGNLKSDQVIVKGNVTGNTTIYVQDMTKSERVILPKITHRPSLLAASEEIIPLNERGISVVQVFGIAKEDSFKLNNPYVTLGGLPYKYVLKAYGPKSQHGESREADVSVVYALLTANSSESAFWDYRLQNEYIDSDRYVSAIVPQAASYLVMPNAIFSAGLADAINQNMLIDSMQKNPLKKKSGKFAISLSSYGTRLTLSSDRTPFDYGYHASVNYSALQTGLSLIELDNQDSITHFGLLGHYGRLLFTPKDVLDAGESKLNKWSVTAYSSTQHYDGFYANALISYGMMQGTITNAIVGDTATIDDAKAWNISIALGKKIDTEVKGLRFEPGAQLVYQNLDFKTISDIDKFNVDMSDPHQWLVRVGGRVSKVASINNRDDSVSLYTKLHLIKTFSNNSTIKMGDQFHIDFVGSSLEGGLGITGELSNILSLYSDISYRYALQKSGTSGASVSGGIRYRF
ncbi:autotransporter outer membrane beta-barrel domain-containing protein [Bartonella bacilliformis]|uniref:Autotransporter domain-containing protein n=2 Tax=Bartonella bacilliformis TaxID=774 RepID=A0A072QY21_BARBA|nr:autotransporter outer membrane beta-barrel domain-containing protein [Bartonella bacilliformis]KEG18316.1 hypothetical protein H710_01165 [Bartonella bacilliformis Ver097]